MRCSCTRSEMVWVGSEDGQSKRVGSCSMSTIHVCNATIPYSASFAYSNRLGSDSVDEELLLDVSVDGAGTIDVKSTVCNECTLCNALPRVGIYPLVETVDVLSLFLAMMSLQPFKTLTLATRTASGSSGVCITE